MRHIFNDTKKDELQSSTPLLEKRKTSSKREWPSTKEALAFFIFLLLFLSLIAIGRNRFLRSSVETGNWKPHNSILMNHQQYPSHEAPSVVLDRCSLISGDTKCSHDQTNIVISSSNGRWPTGLEWVVLKASKKIDGGKYIIHSEDGKFEQNVNVNCSSYVVSLCLHGDHVLYTSANLMLGQYVTLCGEEVTSRSGLEFRVESGQCLKHWNVHSIDFIPLSEGESSLNLTLPSPSTLPPTLSSVVFTESFLKDNTSGIIGPSDTENSPDEHIPSDASISYPTNLPSVSTVSTSYKPTMSSSELSISTHGHSDTSSAHHRGFHHSSCPTNLPSLSTQPSSSTPTGSPTWQPDCWCALFYPNTYPEIII